MTKRAKVRPKRAKNRKPISREDRPKLSPPRVNIHEAAAELLGGGRVFKQTPMTGLGFHKAIQRGFPVRALTFMLGNLRHITHAKFAEVTGLSLRRAQRRFSPRLNRDQSAQLWRVARVLGLAEKVLGERDKAERWLCSPAAALEEHLPIDLLDTGVGAEIVEDVLTQLGEGDRV